jgi:23S rRNA pseudouridine1911/1915/1917 synthase
MKEISNKNNPSTSRRQPHYVVNKRVGDIVQGDKTGDKPLSEVVKEYIKDKYNKPGEVFLGVVHRLDRHNGHSCLCADQQSIDSINELFKNRETQNLLGDS